jgi:hypothetical protein
MVGTQQMHVELSLVLYLLVFLNLNKDLELIQIQILCHTNTLMSWPCLALRIQQ